MSDKRDRHSDRGQLSRLTNYQETQTNRVTESLGGGMAVGEGGGGGMMPQLYDALGKMGDDKI